MPSSYSAQSMEYLCLPFVTDRLLLRHDSASQAKAHAFVRDKINTNPSQHCAKSCLAYGRFQGLVCLKVVQKSCRNNEASLFEYLILR